MVNAACRAPSREGSISSYAYLCRRGARKFLRAGLERSDLEQVAAIGLIKAADRYDPKAETPFEAYAWLLIVGELMHYVRAHERPVRLPRSLHRLERPYFAARERFVRRWSREPSDSELAAELCLDSQTVAELRRARDAAHAVRLDDPLTAADHRTARLLAIDTPSALVDDRLLLELALDSLTHEERRVVVGTFFFGLTQAEVALELGVSAKRVSRIRAGALARMRTVVDGEAAC